MAKLLTYLPTKIVLLYLLYSFAPVTINIKCENAEDLCFGQNYLQRLEPGWCVVSCLVHPGQV